MNPIKKIFRLLHINYIIFKYGLDELIFNSNFKILKYFVFLSPGYWRYKNLQASRGLRLRSAFEELGPIFVKFGQLLSTRVDLLPLDIATQLVELQDNVKPFAPEIAKNILENTYTKSITQIFAEFHETPLASASIAQVHAAKLLTGEEVVIKILRPNIQKQIARDLELIETCAKFAQKYISTLKRFRPLEVVSELKRCLFDELDLLREAANASQLRRNFLNSDLLYIPKIYWDYTRHNILVMERIYGVPVTSVKTLTSLNINLKNLAHKGIEVFFTQVFRDSFFHADMHPGNIWVMQQGSQVKLVALDFGIMGSLNQEDQHYLAENILAFFKRDYRRVAMLHIQSGWIPHDTRLDEFESAIRAVCEPIFERPLKDISFGQSLLQLFQTAKRFNMEIQPQLILLQKTLITIEGVAKQLFPDLDLWHTAQPIINTWMKSRIGIKPMLNRIKQNFPYWIDHLPEIPGLIQQNLTQALKNNAGKRYITQATPPKAKKLSLQIAALLTLIFSLVLSIPKAALFIISYSNYIAIIAAAILLTCIII